jgi:hypothetical protein
MSTYLLPVSQGRVVEVFEISNARTQTDALAMSAHQDHILSVAYADRHLRLQPLPILEPGIFQSFSRCCKTVVCELSSLPLLLIDVSIELVAQWWSCSYCRSHMFVHAPSAILYSPFWNKAGDLAGESFKFRTQELCRHNAASAIKKILPCSSYT